MPGTLNHMPVKDLRTPNFLAEEMCQLFIGDGVPEEPAKLSPF